MLVFKTIPDWQQKLADEFANRAVGRVAFVDGALQGEDMTKLPRYPVYKTTVGGITKECYVYENDISLLHIGESNMDKVIDVAQSMLRRVPKHVMVKLTTKNDRSICTVKVRQMRVNQLTINVTIQTHVNSLFGIVFDEFDLLVAKHGDKVDLANDFKQFKMHKNVVTPKLGDKLFHFDPTCSNPAIHILTWRPGHKMRAMIRPFKKIKKSKVARRSTQLRCDSCHWHVYGKCYDEGGKIICAYCVHTKPNSYKQMQLIDGPVTTEAYVRSQFFGQNQDIILASLEYIAEVRLANKPVLHVIGKDHRYVLVTKLFQFLIDPKSRHFEGKTIVCVD